MDTIGLTQSGSDTIDLTQMSSSKLWSSSLAAYTPVYHGLINKEFWSDVLANLFPDLNSYNSSSTQGFVSEAGSSSNIY
jgi:hypothetical protein